MTVGFIHLALAGLFGYGAALTIPGANGYGVLYAALLVMACAGTLCMAAGALLGKN